MSSEDPELATPQPERDPGEVYVIDFAILDEPEEGATAPQEGGLDDLRETLLRLLAHEGLAVSEEDQARIQACTDPATLNRWSDNVLGAKTASEVLS